MIDDLHQTLHRALVNYGSCTCRTHFNEKCGYHQALEAYELRLAAELAIEEKQNVVG